MNKVSLGVNHTVFQCAIITYLYLHLRVHVVIFISIMYSYKLKVSLYLWGFSFEILLPQKNNMKIDATLNLFILFIF